MQSLLRTDIRDRAPAPLPFVLSALCRMQAKASPLDVPRGPPAANARGPLTDIDFNRCEGHGVQLAISETLSGTAGRTLAGIAETEKVSSEAVIVLFLTR